MSSLQFEWDEHKNALNKHNHGISFETAAHVFRDPRHIELYDYGHSLDEDRFIAIGRVGRVLFVVFTERREAIRIISARYATAAEQEIYYDENIYY